MGVVDCDFTFKKGIPRFGAPFVNEDLQRAQARKQAVKDHSQVELRFFDPVQEKVMVTLLVGALAIDETVHVLPKNRSSVWHGG
jgi:hypothetical protein